MTPFPYVRYSPKKIWPKVKAESDMVWGSQRSLESRVIFK